MNKNNMRDGGGNPFNDASAQEVDEAFLKLWLEDPGFRERSLDRLADMIAAKPGDVLVGITVTQAMIDEAVRMQKFLVFFAQAMGNGPMQSQ
jgi:hypothetical protein